MQYRLSSAALVTLAGAYQAIAQSTPTVTTPTSLVECQPAQFTVSGGTAPYIVSIIPGGQPSAAALETLPTVTAAGSVTWTVDIASGTAVTIEVRDATGALNYSQQVTIQAGTSTSCVGASSASTSTSATTSAASSTASSATSSSSAASSSTVPITSTSSSSSSSSHAASSTTTSTSSSATSAAASASASASAHSSAGALKASGLLAGAAAVFAALFA